MLDLGITGPAQSDYLYHFTGREGRRPDLVPDVIQGMSAQERLDSILREGQFRAFPPFGATTPCVCFSESPPDHLKYLIGTRRFSPWGIVTHRSTLLTFGGGSVAYVPDSVYAEFQQAGLGHWSVRTAEGSTWMHEREWRLPRAKGFAGISSVQAILVGDISWRPSLVEVGWVDRSTGEPVTGEETSPYAEQVYELPRLWRESAIWVWDARAEAVVRYGPGTLSPAGECSAACSLLRVHVLPCQRGLRGGPPTDMAPEKRPALSRAPKPAARSR